MISIIIPAYNEGDRIEETLKSYCSLFRKKKDNKKIEDFEVIVVINNTTDNTEEIVKKISKNLKEVRYMDLIHGGKGFAIKEGFKEALSSDSEIIGFVDADLATDPESVYNLVDRLNKNKKIDGIIGSRYLKNSIVYPKRSFLRGILMSRTFNILVRSLFLFNFRDTQCGAKFFRKEVIEKILPNLSITQWAFDIDLLYNIKKLGFKVMEYPVIWREVPGSKINIKKSSLQMFFAVLQLRLLNSKIKRFWKALKPVIRKIYRRVK